MEPLLYLLVCALVAVNLGWLLFVSVQIRRGLDALTRLQADQHAHRDAAQRRNLAALRDTEGAMVTALRETFAARAAPISS